MSSARRDSLRYPSPAELTAFWRMWGRDDNSLPLTLDNLFGVAVPKLARIRGRGRTVIVELRNGWPDPSECYSAEVSDSLAYPSRLALEVSEDPALAVFWAIWTAVHKVVTKE